MPISIAGHCHSSAIGLLCHARRVSANHFSSSSRSPLWSCAAPRPEPITHAHVHPRRRCSQCRFVLRVGSLRSWPSTGQRHRHRTAPEGGASRSKRRGSARRHATPAAPQRERATWHRHTFFQMGTVALSVSIPYSTAAKASRRWGDDTAIRTLASATGTTLVGRG